MSNYDQGNGQGGEEQTDGGRELLPPGNYRARADKSTVTFGKAKTGSDQVAITFDLLDPKAEGYQQRILWIGTLAGGALDNTLNGIIAAGWVGVDLLALDGIGDVECSLKIKHEADQNGVMRAKVDYVNPLSKTFAFKETLDANGIASLNDRLAGSIMAARERAASGGRGANPSSGARSAPAGGGYGGSGRAPAGDYAPDFDGPKPTGRRGDIPFASCSPLDDPMMRGLAIA